MRNSIANSHLRMVKCLCGTTASPGAGCNERLQKSFRSLRIRTEQKASINTTGTLDVSGAKGNR